MLPVLPSTLSILRQVDLSDQSQITSFRLLRFLHIEKCNQKKQVFKVKESQLTRQIHVLFLGRFGRVYSVHFQA